MGRCFLLRGYPGKLLFGKGAALFLSSLVLALFLECTAKRQVHAAVCGSSDVVAIGWGFVSFLFCGLLSHDALIKNTKATARGAWGHNVSETSASPRFCEFLNIRNVQLSRTVSYGSKQREGLGQGQTSRGGLLCQGCMWDVGE